MNLKLYQVGIIFGIMSVCIVFLSYLTRDPSQLGKNIISQTTSMPQTSLPTTNLNGDAYLYIIGGGGGGSGHNVILPSMD